MTGPRVCEYCGEELHGKRAHARYCDSTCRADAARLRAELRDGGEKALRSAASESSGDVHPLAEARAAQESSNLKSSLSELIYQGIVDRLRHGPVHADDLEPIFPADHAKLCRRLTGAQFGSLASRRYIIERERRKSAVPSRKGAKSGVFEFTRLGREKLAGVSAGAREPRQGESLSRVPENRPASADPGETPSETWPRPSGGAARLFDPEPERPLSPFTDVEAA